MVRKANYEMLIHCNACGEDYSATYKCCPFCGERNDTPPVPFHDDEDDSYVFEGQDAFDDDLEEEFFPRRGGKRLANGGSDHWGGPEPINWPRLITFIASLVIIALALVIVFTVVYPKLHKDPIPNSSQDVATSVGPDSQTSREPAVETGGPDASDGPTDDPNALTGLFFGRTTDYAFTLPAGGSHTISLVTEPVGWSGTVTWTSSDESYATVSADGTVTNVNATSALHRVTITASAEGFQAEAIVHVRPAQTATQPSQGPSSSNPVSQTTPGSLTLGASGAIAGADDGLRVRSGPGTTYEVLASLENGNRVTIVSDAGNGWYEITFTGPNGAAMNGYVMGEYISAS